VVPPQMHLLLLRYAFVCTCEASTIFSVTSMYISATMLFVSTHIILFSTKGHFVAYNNCQRMTDSNERQEIHSR